jgi:hypothetical protein
MKKVAILILLSLFFMIGCQDDNSLLEPTNDVAGSLNKGRVILGNGLTDGLKSADGFTDINTDIVSKYSKSFTVDGAKGGKLYVGYSWINSVGQKVNLSANLIIPSGAYKGILTFDMIFDLDNFALELYPSPFTFDKPVVLNLIFSGVDLTGIDPNQFNFNYLDGASENIKYDYISVDVANKMLEVSGAQLNHFSRYGWTRTK